MKVAVITFPGSNCDDDVVHVVDKVIAQEAVRVWHKDTALPKVDAVVVPGGFSYGDYLRCGALARFSPIMAEVVKFAEGGGPVIGICNGFQILTEAGLLPGGLLRNQGLKFICRPVLLRCENTDTPFTRFYEKDQALTVPIAHGDGRYVADPEVLARLEGEGHVVFRYVDEYGEATAAANPNGSMNNIAGVVNDRGNVLGMMPHPERASEAILGAAGTGMIDGLALWESLAGRRNADVAEAAAAARGEFRILNNEPVGAFFGGAALERP